RECSIQRRHQKVIEETPAPALDDATRAALLECAVAGARRAQYENAGTLEFLYDAAEKKFYFMEVNARVQVEHPVTEMTTGIDIVKAQVEIASGKPLPWKQADVKRSGHAIELRVYAEDPARGFAPQPGKLGKVEWPDGEGVRCDWGYESGQTVPPYYDPLLAKIVAHGKTRGEAVDRAKCALERTTLEGIRNNLAMLRRVLGDPSFGRGQFDTHYLSERKDLLS
ncbi:MAG TPA: biotin carboxylase, partial [Planctomycetota bacterium]|nr:biotin carboxylase [Planctomycetota bacterium]